MLFDLYAVTDPFSVAQGSVLLTFQSSGVSMHAGSTWLSIAIQNAMIVGAHQYPHIPHADPLRAAKKRLWWSIILRDRIMPLALRRTPQVNFSNFDLALDYIEEADLAWDIRNTTVYDAETKTQLARLLSCQCQLALLLTPILMICYNPALFTQSKPVSMEQVSKAVTELANAKASLAEWFESTQQAISSVQADNPHHAILLYSEMTIMHYK